MVPIVVLSPHLDDAVLSCGQLMAGRPGAVVVTVFAGLPPPRRLFHFDAVCGFLDSRTAVAARRVEDHSALGHLSAKRVHLKFLDGQYESPPDPVELRTRLRDVIQFAEPEYVLAPLGLAHPDHVAVREAAVDVVNPEHLYLYEELPARVLWPELVAPALVDVVQRVAAPVGVVVRWERVFLGTGPMDVKEAACREYASQMGVLRDLEDGTGWNAIRCPERYWKLTW